ncbi:hypothetical protein [Mycobacterium sp. SMC-11]|uniref:hypothetical protein n=1 Tax=Mycobacterium sp. SMC-11 TaxID=3385969 RepID=UPI00390C8762
MPPDPEQIPESPVSFYAEGRPITTAEVRSWEQRRADVVLRLYKRHLGRNAVEAILGAQECPPAPAGLVEQRRALAALKAHLRHEQVVEMLSRELMITGAVSKVGVALSRGRRALSSVEMVVNAGTAQGFVDWFMERHDADDQPAMLAANPDHYMITRLSDGRQDVIETTGGSPLPSHFMVTFGDTDDLIIGVDDRYPVRFGGRCRLPGGTEIGAALHQFRDEKVGFSAKLGIEFPVTLPRRLIIGHHWHLACEFSNWVECYLDS